MVDLDTFALAEVGKEPIASHLHSCSSAMKIGGDFKKRQKRPKIDVSVRFGTAFFNFGAPKKQTSGQILLFLVFFRKLQISGQSLPKTQFFQFFLKLSAKK